MEHWVKSDIYCLVPLRMAWARVVVRVAGSWIAAIGVLLLGWAFRPGA
jgi:hypothetical protein